MLSGTVNAWLGLRAATVPFAPPASFPPFLPLELPWAVVEMVRFLASSDSIFLRMAYENKDMSRVERRRRTK
jgi:hypothetical protein